MYELSIDLAGDDQGSTLAVSGELDLETAPQLLEAIRSAGAGPGAGVTVDLSGVTFLDSSGISALIEARRDLQALDRTLTVTNPTGTVLMALQMSGVEEVLNIGRGDSPSTGIAS